MKSSKWWLLAAMGIWIIFLTACQKDSTPKQTESKQQQMVTVYVTDEQLLALKSYSKQIQFVNQTDKYKATLQLLKQSVKADDVALWENIEFSSVKFEGQKLTIDIHIPPQGRLGASSEQLALDALTKTIFQFKEVNEIDVLVDGKAVESMMGHTILKHPITRP